MTTPLNYLIQVQGCDPMRAKALTSLAVGEGCGTPFYFSLRSRLQIVCDSEEHRQHVLSKLSILYPSELVSINQVPFEGFHYNLLEVEVRASIPRLEYVEAAECDSVAQVARKLAKVPA